MKETITEQSKTCVTTMALSHIAELEWEREHEVTLSTEDLASLSETSLTL